jgi:hypothetical protein
MNRRALLVSFLTLFFVLLAFNSLWAVGKPDVTTHEATFLGNAVNMHIEWQSPNPIVTVRISVGNKQKDIKVDPYDNKRNPSGYAGEVTVTIGLDSVPTQPFNYVIQLEDELRMKSELITGKVKVPQVQLQPGMITQPQQPGMQIQIQPGSPPPTVQQPQQPGAQPGGQQAGTIIVIIFPQIAADSGAMWRVGNNPWKRSGEAIPNLPAGFHTVEFQDVGNWNKPENQQVKIEGGQTQTLNGIYFSK